jgi:hypothetical protein
MKLPDAQVSDEKRTQFYKQIENNPLADRPPDKTKYDPADQWGRAKYCAELFFKFLLRMVEDYGLTPEEAIYVNELHSLNFMNLDDFPLSKEAMTKIQDTAFTYYMQNRSKLPAK